MRALFIAACAVLIFAVGTQASLIQEVVAPQVEESEYVETWVMVCTSPEDIRRFIKGYSETANWDESVRRVNRRAGTPACAMREVRYRNEKNVGIPFSNADGIFQIISIEIVGDYYDNRRRVFVPLPYAELRYSFVIMGLRFSRSTPPTPPSADAG